MSYEVIHKYKGFEIEKKEKYYSQGTETWYVVKGVINSRHFDRLKDAKQFIDWHIDRKEKEANK